MAMEWTAMVAGGACLVLLGGLVWVHVQTQAAITRLDDRVTHLLAGDHGARPRRRLAGRWIHLAASAADAERRQR